MHLQKYDSVYLPYNIQGMNIADRSKNIAIGELPDLLGIAGSHTGDLGQRADKLDGARRDALVIRTWRTGRLRHPPTVGCPDGGRPVCLKIKKLKGEEGK